MLLADLRRQGLKLTANGERLDVEPKSVISDELRTTIRAHKAELLQALAGEARPRPQFQPWTRPRYAERRVRRRGRPSQLARRMSQ
jgi:hypothetical protein